MEADFIVTVAALCLVQVLLSVYCYRVWKHKECWRRLYEQQFRDADELTKALSKAACYIKELEDKNSQLLKDIDEQYDQRMNDMISMIEGGDKTFDKEMGLWEKSKRLPINKRPPIGDARSCMDDDNDF